MYQIAATLFITLLAVGKVQGQNAEITIDQLGSIHLQKWTKGYYQIKIKPEPFILFFEGDELHVCAGLTQDLFQHTQPKTDINSDFNSYFNIFKYTAMPEDADYLPVGEDVAATLNRTHGAKPAGNGQSKFKVAHLEVEGQKVPIEDLEEFFMALWLDSNKDQYIDKNELLRIKVVVRSD